MLPIFIGVNVGVPNGLVLVVVRPLHRDSLELTVLLVGHICIDKGHLVSPKEQWPPPLYAALEVHEMIGKLKLVRDIIIIHLKIVVV